MREAKEKITNEVLGVVEALPGVTAREIYTLIPHIPKGTISYALHALKSDGKIVTDGTRKLDTAGGSRAFVTYKINDNPTPTKEGRKTKQPTTAGLREQVERLRKQVAGLEAWKAAALQRCPDLAVAPTVIKARKLVADEVRTNGDPLLADQIIRGMKDETLLVKVAVKALEEPDD